MARQWAYEAVDEMASDFALSLSHDQREAVVGFVDVIGGGLFKCTLLYEALIVGDYEAAEYEMSRLEMYAPNKTSMDKFRKARELFASEDIDAPTDEAPGKNSKTKRLLVAFAILLIVVLSGAALIPA